MTESPAAPTMRARVQGRRQRWDGTWCASVVDRDGVAREQWRSHDGKPRAPAPRDLVGDALLRGHVVRAARKRTARAARANGGRSALRSGREGFDPGRRAAYQGMVWPGF